MRLIRFHLVHHCHCHCHILCCGIFRCLGTQNRSWLWSFNLVEAHWELHSRPEHQFWVSYGHFELPSKALDFLFSCVLLNNMFHNWWHKNTALNFLWTFEITQIFVLVWFSRPGWPLTSAPLQVKLEAHSSQKLPPFVAHLIIGLSLCLGLIIFGMLVVCLWKVRKISFEPSFRLQVFLICLFVCLHSFFHSCCLACIHTVT